MAPYVSVLFQLTVCTDVLLYCFLSLYSGAILQGRSVRGFEHPRAAGVAPVLRMARSTLS